MENIGFHTTWPIFLAIVFGYLGLSLFIGGKKIYFDKFEEPKED